MKKILALALALVMMLAVCVPAFAADIEINQDSDPKTATVDVVTKTTDEADKNPEKYSVTFPASVQIPWGKTTGVEVKYSVTSQLLLGASLKVSATVNDDGKMTATGTDKTLTFTLENGEATFGELCTNEAPATLPTVQIADFSTAPIAEYTGTMTYTVEYVAPAVTPAP